MLDRLENHAARLSSAEADAVDDALQRMRADRTAARTALLSSLRSARYAELRRAIADAAVDLPLTAEARSAGRKELRRAVEKRWKKLRKSVRRLGGSPSDDALHAVRVRAKQCRYAAEACAPVFGRPAERFAAALARVQDVLGEHHDAVVAIEWLAKAAQESPSGEAYALGRLAQIEGDAARDARREFGHAWKRASRGRLRAWI
jgi:CHAD domain-containing protein